MYLRRVALVPAIIYAKQSSSALHIGLTFFFSSRSLDQFTQLHPFIMHLALLYTTLISTAAFASKHHIPNFQARQIAHPKRQPQEDAATSSSTILSPTSRDDPTITTSETAFRLTGLPTISGANRACYPPTDSLPPVPTAPPEVQSALASIISSQTNLCPDNSNLPTITGTAGSDYSSYITAWGSWAREHGTAILSWDSAYPTACPQEENDERIDKEGRALLNLKDCAAFGAAATSTLRDGGPLFTDGGPDATSTSTGNGAPKRTAGAVVGGIFAGVAGAAIAIM